ncbi:hypothetical protein FSP39_011834 [Pinctada imbricata]|uniref:Protein kinase domain-containing protein n=1 Tax=Pinctada imbricata TaxID=66713 RepID=A0AA88XRR9_PINIB|nr:hypothetical protein FSP39_011834 [Pinctada imbricata]
MEKYDAKITDLNKHDVFFKNKGEGWKPDVHSKASIESHGYIFGETIGEGIGTKVKKAYSREHRTNVAIKIFTKSKLSDEALHKFVPREISILQRINHPGIVELLQAFESDRCIYAVFEWIPNGDVTGFVNSLGRLSESDARRIFQQLLNVVSYLHENGICHRDIKLDNILLDEFYNIKLIDFGFSRCLKKRSPLSTNCGSYVYAAPEILQGVNYAGIPADIWSMGVCLYAMLCGRLPFRDDDVDILRMSMKEELKFYKHVSKDCKALLRAMLNVNPRRRPSIHRIRKCKWMCRPLRPPGESSMSSMSVAKVIATHQKPEYFDPSIEHGFLCRQDQKEVKSNRVSSVLKSVAQSHSTGQSSINLADLPLTKASSVAMVTGVSGPVGRKISKQIGLNIEEPPSASTGNKALSLITNTADTTKKAQGGFGRAMKAMRTFKVAATVVRAVRRFKRSPLNTILNMPQEKAMEKMVQMNHEKHEKDKSVLRRSTGVKVAALCSEERQRSAMCRRQSEAAIEEAQRVNREKKDSFKDTVSHLLPTDG